MKFWTLVAGLALVGAVSAWAGSKPVAFRLASLPAAAETGQKLLLCATNIGTGQVDVQLEFINVKTGGLVADTTVTLAPLGAGAAAQPCLSATAETVASAARPGPADGAHGSAMASSFAPASSVPESANGQTLVVGVAVVRKALLSFREAQVTAAIQVLAPDANGAMRNIATIPLSRTTHPSDGAPVYTPPPASSSGHHK